MDPESGGRLDPPAGVTGRFLGIRLMERRHGAASGILALGAVGRVELRSPDPLGSGAGQPQELCGSHGGRGGCSWDQWGRELSRLCHEDLERSRAGRGLCRSQDPLGFSGSRGGGSLLEPRSFGI